MTSNTNATTTTTTTAAATTTTTTNNSINTNTNTHTLLTQVPEKSWAGWAKAAAGRAKAQALAR